MIADTEWINPHPARKTRKRVLKNICEQEVIIEVWISGFFLPCRISGPARTVLSCFVQILYVSFIFPWCLKHLEKPAAQVSK